MSTATLPQLLDADAVAHWLQIPRRRVLKMVEAAQIPYVRLPSGDVVFNAADLSAWIEAQAIGREAAHE
jgi:hypothetical protein